MALVVAALIAGAASAWAVVASSGSNFRVATAGYGDVQQSFTMTGTVTPGTAVRLDFQVAGQVAAVYVSPGQSVSAGQVLASLNTSSLAAEVSQDQAALSSDEAKLDSDEQSETSASSTSGSANGASGVPDPTSPQEAGGYSGGGPTSTESSLSGIVSQVETAQRQLVSDQHVADVTASQATSDLDSAEAICQSVVNSVSGASGSSAPNSTGSSGSGSSGSGSSGSGSSGSGSSGSGTSQSSSDSAQCSSALTQVLEDQSAESQELALVSSDESVLSRLLSELQSSLASSSSSSPEKTTSGGSSGSGSASTSQVVTPATLASDQATIDSEQAILDNAEQSLAEGQLTSPVAGVVAALSMTVGQSVPADSTSADIVVQDPQSFEVTGDVPLSDVGQVRTGEQASVLADGSAQPVQGVVSAISMTVPSSSSSLASSSSSDYRVTVALPAGTPGLFNGADAEMTIVTGQVGHVLTVPTSAVHQLGTRFTVDVLRNGTLTVTEVGVGAVGDELTQITSGLSPGAEVVLANLSEPVPTSSSNPLSILELEGGGGAFRFGGGGGGGRGFRLQLGGG